LLLAACCLLLLLAAAAAQKRRLFATASLPLKSFVARLILNTR
jgi:hypothetical protein